MIETGLDVEKRFAELTETLGQEPLVCEMVKPCPWCGLHDVDCEEQAKWTMTAECKVHPTCKTSSFLVCDPCHDKFVAAGNETPYAIVTDWRPL